MNNGFSLKHDPSAEGGYFVRSAVLDLRNISKFGQRFSIRGRSSTEGLFFELLVVIHLKIARLHETIILHLGQILQSKDGPSVERQTLAWRAYFHLNDKPSTRMKILHQENIPLPEGGPAPERPSFICKTILHSVCDPSPRGPYLTWRTVPHLNEKLPPEE